MPAPSAIPRTAAAYYLNVLKADPRNAELLSRAFLSVLTDGDIDEAGRLADRLLQLDRNDRIARLVLGVRALKQKQYAAGAAEFRAVGARPGHRSDRDAAVGLGASPAPATPRARSTRSTSSPGPDWYAIFKDLHAGMILDFANNKKDAGKRYERAYKADPVGAAHGRGLWPLSVAHRAARTKRSKIYRGVRQGAAATIR